MKEVLNKSNNKVNESTPESPISSVEERYGELKDKLSSEDFDAFVYLVNNYEHLVATKIMLTKFVEDKMVKQMLTGINTLLESINSDKISAEEVTDTIESIDMLTNNLDFYLTENGATELEDTF